MAESDEARTPGVGRGIGGTRSAIGTAILIIALLFLIPPNGILSENEENYFALAKRFVDGSTSP
jgi:hypothetical protein